MSVKLNIGLVGFGVVGEGVYNVIINTPSLQANIKKIAIKNPEKKRNAPSSLFTTDVFELLYDESIDVIIELIDDADEAFWIARTAMEQKKHVVSANKKMIAWHLPELIELQQSNQVSLLYEAAVCASIPIIRNLEEYFDNDLLHALSGIVNGSTNFILTNMNQQGWTYHNALREAQHRGFAESNPTLDVGGYDAVNKLAILLKHAFGIECCPSDVCFHGITSINAIDTQFAREKELELKLVANAFRISDEQVVAFVLPQFIPKTQQLSQVRNEYNGVLISSSLADEQFLFGKGAGRYPTSSAVLSDLSALRYGYRYEYKKANSGTSYRLSTDYVIQVFVSFENEDLMNIKAFEKIKIMYKRQLGGYIIGDISVQTLLDEEWVNHPDISIIYYPEEIKHENLIQSNIQSAMFEEVLE